jgi:uncharacterized protein YdgA (DUF945 family)
MEEKKGGMGSMIGTIIIIAIIILGGLYFWGKRIQDSKINQELTSENADELANIMSITREDDLNTIEADLNSTNLNLDTEI